MKEMAIFLNKIKEYDLFNDFLECDSFDWISKLSEEELKEMNGLGDKEFKDRLFNYIYTNDANYKIKKYDFLKNLECKKSPYLNIVESVLNNFEEELIEYCLKTNNNSSRKMTVFDFLNIFVNAKNENQSKNVMYSLKNLLNANVDNLYEILTFIANCEDEDISDLIRQEIYLNHLSFIDYYIKYLPLFDSNFLCSFQEFYSDNYDLFNRNFLNNNEDNINEIFETGIKIGSDDSYKYSYIERILRIMKQFEELGFSSNLSNKDIIKLMNCDYRNKMEIIVDFCDVLYSLNGVNSILFRDFTASMSDIIDSILNIENKKIIDSICSNVGYINYMFKNNYLEPVYFFKTLQEADDNDVNNLLRMLPGIFWPALDRLYVRKVKRLQNKMNKNNND